MGESDHRVLRRWVNNRLHELLGLSEDTLVEYVCSKAQKCTSKTELLMSFKKVDVNIDDRMRKFVTELWDKTPHDHERVKQKERKLQKSHNKKVKQRMAMAQDFGFVESDEEEQRERKRLKKAKKKLKKKEKKLELKREKKERKRNLRV